MIPRQISQHIKNASKKFPIIGVIGPRQSGKTTLVKNIFSSYTYVSLEDLDNRQFARNDPRGFLDTYNNKVILDEIQKVPELFSYLQTKVDSDNTNGQYVLTGSQHFLLQKNISQNLSGRIALFSLLPLSASELTGANITFSTFGKYIYTGMYPRLYEQNITPTQWYPSYIQTYIERDIRDLTQITNLTLFQTFIKLCAGRIGQLLNLSSLAQDCGISHNTARSWMSLLESSFIVYLLTPYHANFGKRLVKQPKLYFYDTGVACSLLGLVDNKQLQSHYLQGSLFENFVITEYLKHKANHNFPVSYYYWRDKLGHEIDLLIESSDKLKAIEIKSSKTPTEDFFTTLRYFNTLSDRANIKVDSSIIYGGDINQKRSEGSVISWKSMLNQNFFKI